MLVKNRKSIALGKSNNQRSTAVNNIRRTNNTTTTTSTTTTTPPPTPENSNVACLNLAAGLYKKKYEGYFNDINEFFDNRLVSAISNADIGKSYQILDIGTSTQQDWYNWGFIESPQYDTTEALGLPFPSIGKGISYFGGGPIENAGTANLGPVLVSESVSSQIDDSYSQAQGQNNKSLIIKGYFKPTVNGVYKFRLYSDDASYLWFGNDALDGNRTTSNAVVSLPGEHGPYHTDPPGTFTMVANSYYPLTVEFGNGPQGEGVLVFDYMPPGSDTWTSDLAGKLFYDVDSKGHRVCAPPSAYFGRVLSLDAVPYDENPNQISFDGAGVSTVDGVYVYTQTGAPIFGSMFHNTGFYGPVVSGKNNFVEFDVQYGKTGYFVGDWIENDWTYFNTGNIPFVNRVEVIQSDFNSIIDTYTRTNSGDNIFYSLSQNGRRIIKNQNSGWDLRDDDNNLIYINDDINLDPNGWYYDFIDTINLSGFYGYEDGTIYTTGIVISNGGTFNDTYTRVTSSDTATVDDNNINYIPFVNGTKTIASRGQMDLSLGASLDAFRGWYLYDSALSDGDFPRYGINTDDIVPTGLPAYTSVKSFRVSGLQNSADGVYSRSAGLDTPFMKNGSNLIVHMDQYEEGQQGWVIYDIYGNDEPYAGNIATYKLSSAEITTGGWERKFAYKITFSGANNLANGTYIFQNQFDNAEENLRPVLTVLGSGGYNEPRGWRIAAADDSQGNILLLQSPPQTTWWNGNQQPAWYLWEEFGNPPQGLGTVMTSQDRGLTWTSPYIYQFNLGGLPAPHTAYNKTYTFTSAGSHIISCESEGYEQVNRIYYGNNMFYQENGNVWVLQFPYTVSTEGDTFHYIITLRKTGPSPVGTWTSVSDEACTNLDPLIIGGTIVGSNAIAFAPGSGTLPTLSISEIEYVSGNGNYSNPTLTSQVTGNIISVDGTYTRNQGGTTSLSNGTYTISTNNNGNEWFLALPQESEAFSNDNYHLNENNWYARIGYVEGTASNTTARYYPASNKTDGLLGIQYSGYFDSDPTWFNTASVKPIINELFLNHGSSDMVGPYIKIGDQNNQGTSYFQGTQGNAGWAIYYHSAFPTSESYWYLQANIGPIHSKSNDLITWTMTPEAIEEYGDEGAPTTTITQTQNSENSTNFGTARYLSNNTSWQWVGYFRANDTSNHNFYINADENAYFWIGNKALNGYTTGNADMYSIAYNSTNIINLPLTSGTYYPVRLQWGHPANPTTAGLVLSYRNGAQGDTYDFSGLFFNSAGASIATNSNGYVYDFTLGEWQSTQTGYNPVPQVAYSHVWLDSISGFNNSGVIYTGNKHVTLVNNPTYSSGYSGVYSFNGVDQYSLTQEVPQSTDGSISYFVWFKPTGAGTVVSELGQPQINAGWHDSQLEVMQDGKVNFGIWGAYTSNPEFKIQSTGSIAFDRWHHLGLTYAPTSASSGVLSAYINGEKIADSNCPSRLAPGNLYYGICAFDGTHMGAHAFGKGSVGSFQVYNKGLTQTEVGNLYSGEKDRFPNIDNMFLPSLWLDASTGVNKFNLNYTSEIVISGTSNPSFSGTYTADNVPDINPDTGGPDVYYLTGPAGKSIVYGQSDENIFKLSSIGEPDYSFDSTDGINWTLNGNIAYVNEIAITGFTGIYAGANGTYNRENNNYWTNSNSLFYIRDNILKAAGGNDTSIAINDNNWEGAWAQIDYISKVNLFGAEDNVNGDYNANESIGNNNWINPQIGLNINLEGSWLDPVFRTSDNGFDSSDLINWNVNHGNEPVPVGTITYSARSLGSPTSTIVTFPAGLITGTITTSNVATDYVTSWNDQSNNARDVTQSSQDLASLTTIADKKFINFPANTTLGRQSFFNGYTGTVFVVARFDSSSAGSHANLFSNEDGFALSRGADSSNAFYLENVNSDFSENIRTLSNTYANDNTNYIIGATFDNNTASLYLNGAEAGNGSIGNLGVGYNLFIGGSNVGISGPSYEPSNIAEVIAYNRVLNTSERQEVENYLANKYAISLA